ncbi:MAG: PDZ domain-containing protein [Candidatus Eremiobacteraeota bacterium]|nr:PDZ domain-containing protein [Candidatus Eremiobacteraeota bacterium]
MATIPRACGSHGPVIAFVAKGGAADKAAIAAGESLVSVNGRSVRDMSAIDIRDWFSAQPEGKHVTLLVKKPSGEIVARTLVLHDRTVE